MNRVIRGVMCCMVLLPAACAFSARSAGMRDPVIEVVKSLSETQAASIKALTEALTAVQPCGVVR